MIDEICNYEKCTGCAACFSICPKKCISMRPDKEGFLRPAIDEKQCIDCEKCKRTCPINNVKQDDEKEPDAFAARVKDTIIREQSSSGGMFSEFAKYIMGNNGVVIAAGFDTKHNVVHKVCTDITSLDELRRSKYVQSRIGTVYQEAKNLLEEGKLVLFCGTPCQVGGIKAFLGKDYPNLYAVDFICHGVPSPMVWNKYLEFRKDKAQSEINNLSFRSKDTGWQTYSLKMNFTDGSQYAAKVSEDIYLRSFIMDLDLRPSCYQCQFKEIHRLSDITIADFWSIDKLDTKWDDDKGVSLVLVHSEKGKQLLQFCNDDIDLINVLFSDAIASNPSMTTSVRRPALRDRFMRDVQKMPFDKLHDKYCGNSFVAKIRRKIAKLGI